MVPWCSLECTPACHAGGRGFKSRRDRQTPRSRDLGRVAQLAERPPEKRKVTGSTPVPTTTHGRHLGRRLPAWRPSACDGCIAWIARFAASLLFRRVEVAGLDALPTRPAGAARGQPLQRLRRPGADRDRARAAAPLHRQGERCARSRSPGCVLRSAGVVFVHRRVDDGRRRSSNEDAFVECHRALAHARRGGDLPRGHDPRPGPARSDQDRRGPHRPRRPRRRRHRPGHRAGGPHLPRQGRAAVVGARAVRACRSSSTWSHPMASARTTPRRCDSSPRSSIGGIRAVSPDFPDVETAARARPGRADRAQQPGRSRPVARGARSTWPGGSAGPRPTTRRRCAGTSAATSPPLDRAPPHRRRRHRADQPRPPAALRVLDRGARRPAGRARRRHRPGQRVAGRARRARRACS